MNIPKEKPKHLSITDVWGTKIVLFWCAIFLIVGAVLVGVAEGIAVSLMSLIMFFVGKLMTKFVLSLQITNRLISRNMFDYIIMFFWVAGVYGCMSFLFKGLFGQLEDVKYSYFFIAASIFPLGVSVGAAEKWVQGFVYE